METPDTAIGRKGAQVIIRAQGCVMFGTVLSASNWGRDGHDNWYIEYTIDDKRSIRPRSFGGNYGYWKQGQDGGTVEWVDMGGPMQERFRAIADPAQTPLTCYDVRTQTPWGRAQSAIYYARGIVQYSTASHGGFHVSRGLLARMPLSAQTADSYADGSKGWFEEDQAWAIVAVCFPEHFHLASRLAALDIVRKHYPQVYADLQEVR